MSSPIFYRNGSDIELYVGSKRGAIYKYNNIYGDREIKDYIKRRPGESEQQHQLRFILESERIKKEILDFELDMWGY